jgi:hypothetical protein
LLPILSSTLINQSKFLNIFGQLIRTDCFILGAGVIFKSAGFVHKNGGHCFGKKFDQIGGCSSPVGVLIRDISTALVPKTLAGHLFDIGRRQ